MHTKRTLLTIFAFLITMISTAQKYTEAELWPTGAPHSNGDIHDTAKIYIYLPEAKLRNGKAVVICPGGGYEHLSMGNEGHEWAKFLCGQGFAAVVLKYRMPHGRQEVPVEDAEAAMRLVRRNASSWNVDSRKVGIMGFSAGGHLASTVATHSTKDAAPNFQILFYPVITMDPSFTHKGSHDNFLGHGAKKKLEREYSSDQQVTRATPKAFIALSDDDQSVLPANGANYYVECYRHDVPATLHIYPSGGHGWGFRQSFPYHVEMLLDLKAWLNTL